MLMVLLLPELTRHWTLRLLRLAPTLVLAQLLRELMSEPTRWREAWRCDRRLRTASARCDLGVLAHRGSLRNALFIAEQRPDVQRSGVRTSEAALDRLPAHLAERGTSGNAGATARALARPRRR
jgi:hypothetical protein